MPANDTYPPCWLALGLEIFDAAGEVILTHNEDVDVVMPALDSATGVGAFEHIRMLANGGRAQPAGDAVGAYPHDFLGNLQAAWDDAGGTGTWTAGIDEDDLFWIENSSENYIVSGAGDCEDYGMPSTGYPLLGGSAPFRRSGTTQWARGIFSGQLRIIGLSGASVLVPTHGVPYQDLVTMCRPYDIGDVADTSNNVDLETVLNDALDAPHRRIRVYLGADKRITVAWAQALGLGPIIWPAGYSHDTMRVLLGAHGDEEVVATASYEYVTFSRPPPSLLAPSLPLKRFDRTNREKADIAEPARGPLVAVHEDHVRGWNLAVDVDGPVGAGIGHANGRTGEDLSEHMTDVDGWLEYARAGERLSVVIGHDWRIYRPERMTSSTVPPYDLVYTAEPCRGLYATQIAEAIVREQTYPEDVAIWSELQLRLVDHR